MDLYFLSLLIIFLNLFRKMFSSIKYFKYPNFKQSFKHYLSVRPFTSNTKNDVHSSEDKNDHHDHNQKEMQKY